MMTVSRENGDFALHTMPVAELKEIRSDVSNLQRMQSTCKVGSNRYKRLAKLIANKSVRATNIRKEAVHKSTHTLTSGNSEKVIKMETLQVGNMVKNAKIAKNNNFMMHGDIKEKLTYKALRTGKSLLFVDRFFPSSKTCRFCNHVHADISSHEHQVCEKCGAEDNRDIRASHNIRLAPALPSEKQKEKNLKK